MKPLDKLAEKSPLIAGQVTHNSLREQPPIRWKSIALPTEHGGWGFVLEPIILGLLVVPSVTALFLALAVFASFLVHTPLKIIYKDLRRDRRSLRTLLAGYILSAYVSTIIFSVALALYLDRITPLLPLLLASPLAAITLYYDLTKRGRTLLRELLAPLALAAVVVGMALARDWTLAAAIALWSIPVLRSIPTIFYVRARLRLGKGKSADILLAISINVAAFVVGVILLWLQLIPALTVGALFILLVRAVYGLSPYRRHVPAKIIGWSEIGYGLLIVVLTATGYALNL